MKKLVYDNKDDFILMLKMGDEYSRLEKESNEWVDELKKSLGAEQRELVDKILRRRLELETDAIRTAYTEGIQLGLRLAAESFK